MDYSYQPAATLSHLAINTLTTMVHLNKPSSVFVHYQFSVSWSNTDFHSKLLINDNNAGSLVDMSKQEHRTPTGFWMANLNTGHYTCSLIHLT